MNALKAGLAGLFMGSAILGAGATDADAASFRSYTAKGKTKEGACVAQVFKWDEGRLSKADIKSQAASVRSAFPGVARKFTFGELKSASHVNKLLTGRVPKDGSVTFNGPTAC